MPLLELEFELLDPLVPLVLSLAVVFVPASFVAAVAVGVTVKVTLAGWRGWPCFAQSALIPRIFSIQSVRIIGFVRF